LIKIAALEIHPPPEASDSRKVKLCELPDPEPGVKDTTDGEVAVSKPTPDKKA